MEPIPPRLTVPAGSCDCHSHIFGPAARYPMAPDGSNPQPDASVADYRAVLDGLGIERSVIVQPAPYGSDNRRTLDAVAELGPHRARGVAVCTPEVTDRELADLHRGGIRGIRFCRQGSDVTFAVMAGMARRLADLGLHIQVQAHGADALTWLPHLEGVPVPVVIPHIARMPADLALDDPRFVGLLRALDGGNVWIKLSGAYYGSRQGPPYADVLPRLRALVAARPDRLVWALNWPHPTFAADAKPAAAPCFDVVARAIPDAATRQAVFAGNAAVLYDFPD